MSREARRPPAAYGIANMYVESHPAKVAKALEQMDGLYPDHDLQQVADDIRKELSERQAAKDVARREGRKEAEQELKEE